MNPSHRSSPQSPLFYQADQWFSRSRALLLDALPCQKGCHRCCIGPFPITMLDRVEIQRGLDRLPQSQRHNIEQRATEQTSAMETRYPRLQSSCVLDDWDDALIDQLATDFAEFPCPALQPNGSCGIYESRPITCRTMGIPPNEKGLVQGACEIQTAVPLIQLSRSLGEEEVLLAEKEALALSRHAQDCGQSGEELLLPYGFLVDALNRGTGTLESGNRPKLDTV